MQENRTLPYSTDFNPKPEEAWEWRVELGGFASGWQDLESADQAVEVAMLIIHEGDWFTVQSKGLDHRPAGRFVQAANTGDGYLVEVAQVKGKTTLNWRVGLGPAADAARNEPNTGPADNQNLSFSSVIEVVVSWLRGAGLPVGYGASLCVYDAD
ncbi:hypothetical protein [Arthrobacter sp. FW306-06-A]|uniref:hypothetical protein n=1 Tax=Arthrobacter sp. FW306-06-A TaxID=2879621 RepID=UPI001F1745F7|nr:hypothetical protein [Arthrobacter sp. FW306-06-A]UKA72236.1 hypothetical protein LFT49_05760 [Arthrobacter sp. FW306-06-A]